MSWAGCCEGQEEQKQELERVTQLSSLPPFLGRQQMQVGPEAGDTPTHVLTQRH